VIAVQDEALTQSILTCFDEQVEPLFEMQMVKERTLEVTLVSDSSSDEEIEHGDDDDPWDDQEDEFE